MSTKTKFEIKREATREALLEAGIKLLFERGYAGTKAADVAREAGHTTGAFYFHFETKEDFFFAVLAERQQRRQGWHQTAHRFTHPQDSLTAVLAATLQELDSQTAGSGSMLPLIAEFTSQAGSSRSTRRRFKAIHESWIAEIAEFIQILADGGWLATEGLEPNRRALQLHALVEGYEINADLFGPLPEDALLEACLALLSSPSEIREAS